MAGSTWLWDALLGDPVNQEALGQYDVAMQKYQAAKAAGDRKAMKKHLDAAKLATVKLKATSDRALVNVDAIDMAAAEVKAAVDDMAIGFSLELKRIGYAGLAITGLFILLKLSRKKKAA